jgi:Polyketide cyclase / dehydrase and lipid transport
MGKYGGHQFWVVEAAMQRLDRDEVRRHIGADAGTLYALVSDVPRTPEWSPEVIASAWTDRASGPTVGARFTAKNKRRWLTWSNRPVVTVAEPGRAFAIQRSEHGGGTVAWRYDFIPAAGGGTEVRQSYQVVQPVPLGLHWVLRVLFGVRDLRADLHANLETSLARLAAIAEANADSPAVEHL